MAVISPIIDAQSSVQRPLPAKAILWPTALGRGDGVSADSLKFPNFEAIKARHAAKTPEPLEAFAQAVREAQDSVLIIDDYLFKPTKEKGSVPDRVSAILEWFPYDFVAKDVRILTREVGTPESTDDVVRMFQEHSSLINTRAYDREINLQVRFTLVTQFDYVHDRYAIIDDELWHFGATVGGFHHQVNAATRGWSAREHDAYTFFDLAWRGDNDRGRSHDGRRSRG